MAPIKEIIYKRYRAKSVWDTALYGPYYKFYRRYEFPYTKNDLYIREEGNMYIIRYPAYNSKLYYPVSSEDILRAIDKILLFDIIIDDECQRYF